MQRAGLRGIVRQGVILSPTLQRRMIRGLLPGRLRHSKSLPSATAQRSQCMRLALLSILATLVASSAFAQAIDPEYCRKKCEAEAELMIRRIQQSCNTTSLCEKASAQQRERIPLCVDECVFKQKFPN
jgi:hypothetical protein